MDRIGYLLAKIDDGKPLTAHEHSECLRLGIKPDGPRLRKRKTAYDVAQLTGCSDRTYRKIFG